MSASAPPPTPDDSDPIRVIKFCSERIRQFMRPVFPKLHWTAEKTPAIVEDILQSYAFQLALALVLFVLAFAKVVSVTVACALVAASFIALFGILRSRRLSNLTPTIRLGIRVLCALVFVIGAVFLGKWAVRQIEIPKEEIKLVFKASPLFTVERKKRITNEVGTLYHYLTHVGFDIPKEIPPLGTRSGKSMSEVFSRPGTIYDAAIFFPKDGIDNPKTIRNGLCTSRFP